MTQFLIWTAGAMVAVAAALTLWRLARGPSSLDRIVSADVLVSLLLVAVCLVMVLARETSALSIVLVGSMVAFTGGVSVAKLLAPGSPERQRYRRESEDRP